MKLLNDHMIRKTIHWGLLVFTLIVIISGLGITYFRLVEPATFGLLTKALAFRIHTLFWIPFLIFLAIHLYLTINVRRTKK